MQTSPKSDLPKRSRYYQGMIDLNTISRGDPYKKLKKSFVIFICCFDPFKAGRAVYTFENFCREDKSIPLDDKTHKVFINPYGDATEYGDEMETFLAYIQHDTEMKSSRLTDAIQKEVERVREHKEWRTEYMTLQMKYQEFLEEGREEGLEEGREEGREEGLELGREEGLILGRLKSLKQAMSGGIPETDVKKIFSATDEELNEAKKLSIS